MKRLGFATPLWRALIAYRVILLGYAAMQTVHYWPVYTDRRLALAVFVTMVLWTVAMTAANALDRGRRWVVCLADLTVSAVLLVMTYYVLGGGDPEATVTGPWVSAAVLACAILGGPWRGMAASLVIIVITCVLPGVPPSQNTLYDVVMLLMGGGVVGLVSQLLRDAEWRMTLLTEREAAVNERERLARIVHDGVLQVLTLVHRRGPDLGPDGAELARLAGEQEAALRGLVLGAHSPVAPVGEADLSALLTGFASTQVSVSGPAVPVLLPADRAAELVAAVAAALDNVARHAGPGARAWVTVEEERADVLVSVRDDGRGATADQVEGAAASGRLGVAQSMRGRAEDLGGTMSLVTAPGQGTEVEFRVPRRADRTARR
ncbi:histidine kinase [Longispora fulva]|uniref:Signal transduction histidine kinase n=1 Tax=Longispora fulva TaxID=619741 RepID=A0A8J7GIP5_9ACTN|nr:DUF5931 domain-containing protein [Longispora fulva]MBG6141363.1 signal transduction histidine kinase [Longispora fulva]GIG59487.1 histidine kinase [Longispora fulva]